MYIFRVQQQNDAYFKLEVQRHNLTSQLHQISQGATENFNTYVNQAVNVYVITSGPQQVGGLISDLQLNSPTKTSFTTLSKSEIYI